MATIAKEIEKKVTLVSELRSGPIAADALFEIGFCPNPFCVAVRGCRFLRGLC